MSTPQVYGEYYEVDPSNVTEVAMACRRMLTRMLDRLHDCCRKAPLADRPAVVGLSLSLRGGRLETRMELRSPSELPVSI